MTVRVKRPINMSQVTQAFLVTQPSFTPHELASLWVGLVPNEPEAQQIEKAYGSNNVGDTLKSSNYGCVMNVLSDMGLTNITSSDFAQIAVGLSDWMPLINQEMLVMLRATPQQKGGLSKAKAREPYRKSFFNHYIVLRYGNLRELRPSVVNTMLRNEELFVRWAGSIDAEVNEGAIDRWAKKIDRDVFGINLPRGRPPKN